jgi:hypothetical protein
MIFAFMLAPGNFVKNRRAGRAISEYVGVQSHMAGWFPRKTGPSLNANARSVEFGRRLRHGGSRE